jgi:hypothetical protein
LALSWRPTHTRVISTNSVITSTLSFRPGFDTVISLAGDAAVKLQPGMIDAAISGGVRHFYPSELSTDFSYGDIGKKRWFRDKVETR